MRLTEIGAGDDAADSAPDPRPITREIVGACQVLYQQHGYRPPWLGYFAFDGDRCVGACGFKSPPVDGRVEIAYFTLPGHEGQGHASAMARLLVDVARGTDPQVVITAQTLPAESASTAILRKLGFAQTGTVDHPEDGPVWEWKLDVGR